MLETECGIKDVDRHDLYTTVTGINHFTWITNATYKGMDLIPLYRKFCEKHWAEGYDEGGDDNWLNSFFKSCQRVKMDLFLKFGYIAAAGDRHLAEFMPNWYLRDPESVHGWKFNLTTVKWRKEDLKRRLQKSDDIISGKHELEMEASGEEGHLMIKALLGMEPIVANVNMRNQGQIPNLPIGAVVETNAYFIRDSIEPLSAGPLPESLLGLIGKHVTNQENTLKAALTCDRELAFTTFMNDPQMTLDAATAKKLFDEMLEAQRKYLPAKWFE